MNHRIGLIGCGGIAETWIQAAEQNNPYTVELADLPQDYQNTRFNVR